MRFETYHHVPLSNYDLLAIGAVLCGVIVILLGRKLWRTLHDSR